MGKINVLDSQVANLIAAGEVVDRPASVIKELVENAIDAGSTSVTVEIKRGGIQFMRVSDNGCGMTKDDVPVCIKRHATSKIKDQSDLDEIMTLGFRGEALAAIGAVSVLRILTKPENELLGTSLTCESGEIKEIVECGCQNGTTIIVEELFKNVPARRKFLKKDSSETMAVAAVMEKMALSRPNIAIKFITDGILKFSTAGDGNLKNCIYAVLGREYTQKMTEVNLMTNGIEVKGYIGNPEFYKANRNYQNFFINGRYVKSRTAMAAIEQAFVSYIPSEKFPACVLELIIHPALVDVNVHPAKLEVKFSNEQIVFDAVYNAVRTALESKITRPEFELKSKEKAKNENKLLNPFIPLKNDTSDIQEGKGVQISLDLNEHKDKNIDTKAKDDYIRPKIVSSLKEKIDDDAFSAPFVNSLNKSKNTNESEKHPFSKKEPVFETKTNLLDDKKDNVTTYSVTNIRRNFTENKNIECPDYKIIGEAFNSYVLVECVDKVLLIDKHAAHERILFENMKRNIEYGAECQLLLVPIRIKMNPEEIAVLKDFSEQISSCGIGYSVNEDTYEVIINEIPTALSANQTEEMISVMAEKLIDGTGNTETVRKQFYEQALYQASCKAAIKAGRIYDQSHIDWIVKNVMTIPEVRYCPHGRPVAFELTKNEIEHWFKRK